MSQSFSAPGVYIEEISSGARPIQAVGTSTVGFIGKAPNIKAHLQEAVRINNWYEFVKKFVLPPESQEPNSENKKLVADEDTKPVEHTFTDLAKAVYGFYQNCSGVCYIVNIGDSDNLGSSAGKERQGIDLFEEIDEIALVAAPGFTSTDHYNSLLKHCEKLKDRFAILDPSIKANGADALLKAVPRQSKDGFGAVYYPSLKVRNIFAATDGAGEDAVVTAPPSGHLAGIYARVDSSSGVHKAPANETINGAQDLTYQLTREDIGKLNDECVNCLKNFPGEGIKVWGARTRAGAASNWRYINVRRLFNMIEESIAKSTTWVVFEPNDFTLWNAIRRDVTAFLTTQWRQGALKGKTPEEAFYVKCDEETNPPDVINAGKVITEIGIAPVKPAEFVVFRIGQTEKGSQRI